MPTFYELMTEESKDKWRGLAKELGTDHDSKFSEVEDLDEIAELMQLTDAEFK